MNYKQAYDFPSEETGALGIDGTEGKDDLYFIV
jgi:hypothetical protein